jgi:hypothetical protein
MSSLLSSIESGAENVETDVLGPGYDYASKIPTPDSLGVGTGGDMGTTMNNIQAGLTYADYLITGPNMGNKYFIRTGAQCTAVDTSGQVDRWKYLDQSADQPMFSDSVQQSLGGMGGGNTFDGMVPGILVGVMDLNPMPILSSMVGPDYPPCQQVTCPTGDVMGSLVPQTQYVGSDEIQTLVDQYGCTASGYNQETFKNKLSDIKGHMGMLLIPIGFLILLGLIKK